MDGFLDGVTIAFPNEEGWDFKRATLSIIPHGSRLDLIFIDNHGHYSAKFLNILNFLYEMAIAAIHHYDVLMAIKRSFFKMNIVEVGLVEGIAAILIRQWIVNATLVNALLIKLSEGGDAGLEETLVSGAIEVELAGQ